MIKLSTIRQATLEDLNNILLLVSEFYEENLYQLPLHFDEITLRNTIQVCINNHIALVYEEEDKILATIGGIIMPSSFDSKQLICQELMWYVSKQARSKKVGFKLIEAFEIEGKKMGASVIIMAGMGNLNSEKLDKFYKSKNYQFMETHYIKEV